MMNREVRRTNSTSRPNATSRQSNAPSYLVYLFFASFVFMILLPYIVPWMAMFQRSTKKTENDIDSKPRETLRDNYLSSMPQSYANSPFQRSYLSDAKYDALESLILDIQRAVQMERERTVKLENDVRILELSERFLKERLQMVETRNTVQEPPKASSNSLEMISQNTDGVINPNIDVLLRELQRLVKAGNERMNSLNNEIEKLKMSESNLKDRMELLELKFSSLMTTSESLHLPRFITT